MSGDQAPDRTERMARRRAARRARRQLKLAGAEGIMRGLRAGLGPGCICVDCGAHYGTVTTELAATGATVHAFEPDPHSWGELTKNCGQLENVTLHNAAVATEAGELTLYRNEKFETDRAVGSTGSTILAENVQAKDDDTHKVPAIDLPAFLSGLLDSHGSINFLKMDIEGAELPILEKLVEGDILTRINLTAVETHRWLFPDWRERYARLYEVASARPELNLYLHWI